MNIPPVPEEFRTRLLSRGDSDEKIQAIWNAKQAIEWQSSSEAGQYILDECLAKGYLKKPVRFQMWHDGNVIGQAGTRKYLVVGSYGPCGRYTLRGTMRQNRAGSRLKYSFNGQAGTGGEQIAHIAEQDYVEFPEVEAIQKEYSRAMGFQATA